MLDPIDHARTRVHLCGGFTVEIDGRRLDPAVRGRQARLLFAYLVLHRRRPVRRDELVEALWPARTPGSAPAALNTLVSRLRRALGAGVICGRSELALVLPLDAWVDVEAASEAMKRAEQALETADWRTAASAANRTLAISEQGFLPAVAGGWAEAKRREIEEYRLRALECVAAAGLGLGGAGVSQTERAGRALIALSPYRETGHRYLMLALAERGRVAEALRVFDDVRRLLHDELGTPPGAGLRSLHERLLSEQPTTPYGGRDDPLAVGSGALTVLFCDAARPAADGGERAARLQRTHARVLRHAVAAQGGRTLNEIGGGGAAVFLSSASALACATQTQQAAALHDRRHPDSRLDVRVALHRGDPGDAERDVIAVARRLCEGAHPGQILTSGQAQSSGAVEVAWEPAQESPFALPAVLSTPARDPFVGRESDSVRLWRLYETVCGASSQVVLIRGEPGIGKTRLATELALRAHADGAVVLYGRCDEEPLVPHQPFIEALRHYMRACPLSQLLGQLGSGGGELRRIVPELADRLPDLAQPLAGDPEGERYRFFEAVSGLLCEAAEVRPLVLVLDDLHWADTPSLLLLTHLVRCARESPLLIVGTHRDTEPASDHELLQTIAELSREHSLERHDLACLDEAAVGQLARSQGDVAADVIARIFAETDGNPFFVVETLRHLAEFGDPPSPAAAPIPEGVKAVITRRVARLGHSTRRALSVASVAGREFELGVLQQVVDLDEEHLIDALEPAVAARVIEELAGTSGRFTFSHALIRETIYRELTSARRALLHRRIGTALEAAHAADLEPHCAQLAHHFARAGTARDLDKAIDYGALAGSRAMTQLAYEQAGAHYRQAVNLIKSLERPRPGLLCDLAIAQGEAERRAGDRAYHETLLESARLARQLADPERLGRAALANNRGFFSATAGVDRERVATLEAALEAQEAGDTAMRANLLAHLAVELVPDPDWERRARLSDEALAMARRVGDPTTLLRTLNNRYTALWGPRTLPERLANTLEATALADRLGDPGVAFYAVHFGAHAAMEAGELELADERLGRAAELAAQLRQPIIQWYTAVGRGKRSSISGALAEAERLAHHAFALGRDSGQLDSFAWFANQMVAIRFLQGELGGGRPNFLKAAESGAPYDASGEPSGSRSIPLLVEAVHIVTLCEVGRCDDARGRFDALMANGLSELPHDWAALAIPALASVGCAHLGDVARAETLYAMLAPHRSQFVDAGPSWLGATAHYLAMLAATLGRWEESEAQFAAATEAYAAFRADAWLTRARLDWSRTLLARGTKVHRQPAQDLLGMAIAGARELGLSAVEQQAASLLETAR